MKSKLGLKLLFPREMEGAHSGLGCVGDLVLGCFCECWVGEWGRGESGLLMVAASPCLPGVAVLLFLRVAVASGDFWSGSAPGERS